MMVKRYWGNQKGRLRGTVRILALLQLRVEHGEHSGGVGIGPRFQFNWPSA